MKTTTTQFTIAEYCEQMQKQAIVVNNDYQRSPRVWPPAAKSYLLETILLNYPVPKLSLYQKTDLKSRKTIKEIVDGQQRSVTILSFYENRFRVTGKGQFAGLTYETLDDEKKREFLSYPLSCDIFIEASDEAVRQVFRRINSYTVPLNPQEKRHAVFQGEFKWFMVGLCERYDQALKSLGVFNEKQLSRMLDAKLLTEICHAFIMGLQHASEKKLDDFYKRNETTVTEQNDLDWRLTYAMDWILRCPQLHGSILMKSYNFFTLCLAIGHCMKPSAALADHFDVQPPIDINTEEAVTNLSTLADAIERPADYQELRDFVEACSKATTRQQPRITRFRWMCRAISGQMDG